MGVRNYKINYLLGELARTAARDQWHISSEARLNTKLYVDAVKVYTHFQQDLVNWIINACEEILYKR